MVKNKCFATAYKSETLDQEMSIVCYASTNEVDRHGEMILSSAWTEKGLKSYRKNPIILLNHDYHSLPIAKSIWQKSDSNGLKFKIKFADTEAGKEVYSLYKGGYMSSFSVGFKPLRVYDNEDTKKYKDNDGNVPHTVYEECELLELSCVSVPANPSANIIRSMKSLVDKVDCGEFKSKEVGEIATQIRQSSNYIEALKEIDLEKIELEKIELESKEKEINLGSKELDIDIEEKTEDNIETKIETTEDYHHIPVEDADKFDSSSFKTIEISSGIKAVIGKLKSDPDGSTHTQKYLFDVDSFTLEEAKGWVKEHSKEIDKGDVEEKEFILSEESDEISDELYEKSEEVEDAKINEDVTEKEIEQFMFDPIVLFGEDGKLKEVKDFPKDSFKSIDEIEFNEDGSVKSVILVDKSIIMEKMVEPSLKELMDEIKLLKSEIDSLKSKEIEIEEKEIDLESIEIEKKEESLEIDITKEQLGEIVRESIVKCFNKDEDEIDLSEIAKDALKKAKGIIF